ncbi:protein phosphatase 2c, putative [Ichthyophthirius multifiliis]|uniref:Protein phosphatase 2c, putative n=1 Tax=Ichthyophthirius multifiliis TaxID=5932 RepID=G0QXD3_ICHMU|nr:protein phosphatase 2c, putative [Ichthyophthirius multifiliis]EGR30121.1 protein phosphatase 2c, putative [Ichthyophthirius multifiliis]|eukprot:XP_004031357.1 protein phosphatase 2c, putative [Ichthyophthirius multifiliis]
MEDAHFFKEINSNEFIFGILDGHNGQQITQYVVENLPQILTEKLIKNPNKDISEILIKVFEEMSQLIYENIPEQAQETGTTCTVCVLRNENNQKVLYSANLGDSKAILYTNDQSFQLTIDHRASKDEEIQRIKKFGGYVSMGRIQGILENYFGKQYGLKISYCGCFRWTMGLCIR